MKIKVVGGLKTVSRVDAVTEKRIDFNGKVERLVAIAKENRVVNGLLFTLENNNVPFVGMPQESIFIGNLSNSVAQCYMETLGEKGYLNLSRQEYQKEKSVPTNYVFDNGKSKPYMCDGNIAMYSTANMLFSPYSVFGKEQQEFMSEEDYEEEGDDCVDMSEEDGQ